MTIPLVDLRVQYCSIKEEVDAAIQTVLENGQFILGPEVEALEKEVAQYWGVKYGMGVASGTDALHLSLLACGIEPGDEVITTPFTFIATAEAITRCGATPVFVDIDPKTYNLNPEKLAEFLEGKSFHHSRFTIHHLPLTIHQSHLKAIIPVHLYGQPAEMDAILALAKRYNLKVIEDCAQALGATYSNHQSPITSPQKVGSLGDAGCLSFFPAKNLGAYGDGGMVVTNNPEIAEKVKMLRNHGCKERYYHLLLGFNSRLDELQAAILRVKLRHLDEWIKLRGEKASYYAQLLGEIEELGPPYIEPYSQHAFNYYTIRLNLVGEPLVDSRPPLRDKLREYLGFQGVATAVYYPLSLHLQEMYKPLGYKSGDFPESEKAQEEVLSLPMYPELSKEQIERVVEALKNQIQSENGN